MSQSNWPQGAGVRAALSRRTFLVASGLGFCGTALGAGGGSLGVAKRDERSADSTILIFLCGGASHIDTWDMKPEAPVEYRGPFRPVATSAPDIQLCEHLPMTAKQAHHLAIVRSLGHFKRGTGDHHAGYYYNLTGQRPDESFPRLLNNRKPTADDAPFMGSVVGAKLPAHPYLPNLVTLPKMPGHPNYTRPGQFAARLGVVHDPLYIYGDVEKPLDFKTPALSLHRDVTAERLQSRRSLLSALDGAQRVLENCEEAKHIAQHQQKAFSLLGSAQAKEAFDVWREPEAVRAKYGDSLNGVSMLMARRLVEAGVPFVTVFWNEDPKLASKCKSAGGWDTHGNNFNCLKENLLPEFDRGYAALLDDLHKRGRLDRTLVMVTSEMGRDPKIGDRRSGGIAGAGRDHWTHCMSVLLAGGGIRGGQVYGSSDRHAAYPEDKPVAPEDIAKTVYHAMGVNDVFEDVEARLPKPILEHGAPLTALF